MTYKIVELPHKFQIPRIYLQDLIDRFNDCDDATPNGSSFAITTNAPVGFVNIHLSEASYNKWLDYANEIANDLREQEERIAAHAERQRKIYEEWGHLLP
jgi:hypothetical protein